MKLIDDEQGFNYVDALTTAATREYTSMQHDTAVQATGRVSYIFKLDKAQTEKSEVYGSETKGRVYLPHFSQRGVYITNTWQNMLTLNNYEETEDKNLTIEYNFDRMVRKIRELKTRISGTLSIKNNRKNTIVLNIEDGIFKLKLDENKIIIKKLTEYPSMRYLIATLNEELEDIVLSYEGNGEKAENLKNVSNIVIRPRHTKYVEVEDRTYVNTTDVIELGDILLTDKFKAYSVVKAVPGGTLNDYTTWVVQGSLIDLALVDGMPNDYRQILKQNRYSLPKTNME